MDDKNNKIIKRINEIIDELKPFLISDGGTLEFIKYENGIAYVKLGGACENCAFLDITLKDGIEEMIINEIPEVKEVRNIN